MIDLISAATNSRRPSQIHSREQNILIFLELPTSAPESSSSYKFNIETVSEKGKKSDERSINACADWAIRSDSNSLGLCSDAAAILVVKVFHPLTSENESAR